MVFAVDRHGRGILGLYRMPDATVFSIDVAVAKARNVAYYADPVELQPIDRFPGLAQGRGDDQPDLPLPGRAAIPRRDRHRPARPVLDPQCTGHQSANGAEYRSAAARIGL